MDRNAIRANLRKTVFTFYPVRHEIKGKSCEKQGSGVRDQGSEVSSEPGGLPFTRAEKTDDRRARVELISDH
jgi:hypothetical protein